MKIPRILLLALPLCFLAASSFHQVCGPLRFGMKGAELQKASAQLRASANGTITAATLRQGLVTDGMRYPEKARFANRDNALPLEMRYAPGRPLSEVTFQSHEFHPAGEYDSAVKQAWETLQDVAESKFARVTRKGEFPPMASIDKTGKVFVTDTWEVDGIRVEVGIQAGGAYGDPAPKYTAVLKASDLVAAPSAK